MPSVSCSKMFFGRICSKTLTSAKRPSLTVKASQRSAIICNDVSAKQTFLLADRSVCSSSSLMAASVSADLRSLPNSLNSKLTDIDFRLDEIKVFQDEQIIQLAFKCGKTINYTMQWLRNFCPCPECFNANSGRLRSMNSRKISTNTRLNVVRIKNTSESEVEIDWLDNEYKSHSSVYQLADLMNQNPKS